MLPFSTSNLKQSQGICFAFFIHLIAEIYFFFYLKQMFPPEGWIDSTLLGKLPYELSIVCIVYFIVFHFCMKNYYTFHRLWKHQFISQFSHTDYLGWSLTWDVESRSELLWLLVEFAFRDCMIKVPIFFYLFPAPKDCGESLPYIPLHRPPPSQRDCLPLWNWLSCSLFQLTEK